MRGSRPSQVALQPVDRVPMDDRALLPADSTAPDAGQVIENQSGPARRERADYVVAVVASANLPCPAPSSARVSCDLLAIHVPWVVRVNTW